MGLRVKRCVVDASSELEISEQNEKGGLYWIHAPHSEFLPGWKGLQVARMRSLASLHLAAVALAGGFMPPKTPSIDITSGHITYITPKIGFYHVANLYLNQCPTPLLHLAAVALARPS